MIVTPPDTHSHTVNSVMATAASSSGALLSSAGGPPPMSSVFQTPRWADMSMDEDDDDNIEGLVSWEPDGTKVVTRFFQGPDRKQQKSLTRIKVTRVKSRTSKAAQRRKLHMTNFGFEALDKDSEDYRQVATGAYPIDEPFRLPRRTGILLKDAEDEDPAGQGGGFGGSVGSSTLLGSLETLGQRKLLNEMRQLFQIVNNNDPNATLVLPDRGEDGLPSTTAMGGRAMEGMGGGVGGGPQGGRRGDDEYNTVRVTNLSEDVTEASLRQLFNRCGEVLRCKVPKCWETDRPRGYAFITYAQRSSAEEAIKRLHKQGFENMLLSVEWTKKREF